MVITYVRLAIWGEESALEPGQVLLLGRSSSNEIVLSGAEVSRVHAEISYRAGGLELRDCASANGTWVEGTRVERYELQEGSVIAIGNHRLRIEVARPGSELCVPRGRHLERTRRCRRTVRRALAGQT